MKEREAWGETPYGQGQKSIFYEALYKKNTVNFLKNIYKYFSFGN